MLNRPVARLNVGGNIDMKDYEIKNVGDPTDNKSAVNKKWSTDNNFNNKGGIMHADISLGGFRLFDLPEPKIDSEATSKKWVESKVTSTLALNTSGFTMTGNINMGGNEIKNIGAPSTLSSAV
jgi:hypothetical protein